MSSYRMFSQLKQCLYSFEEMCSIALGLRFVQRPPMALCAATTMIGPHSTSLPVSEKDLGFLWAVPRNRRTVEKRWKRKYGHTLYGMKLIPTKQNLIVCNTCGHFHEAGVLCGNCYAKVMEETKAAQKAVEEKLGLSAVDKEVILLYEDEPAPLDQNKKVVEIPRPRPQWFSRNLMQRSTDVPSPKSIAAETVPVNIKPSDLG